MLEPSSLEDWLFRWQNLVGALLGGIVGLIAALIVARDARRRVQNAAAAALKADLLDLSWWLEALDKVEGAEGSRELWEAYALSRRRPELSGQFQSWAMQVMDVDRILADSLRIIRNRLRLADTEFAEFEADPGQYLASATSAVLKEARLNRMRLARRHVRSAQRMAEEIAIPLLSRLFGGGGATLERLKRKLRFATADFLSKIQVQRCLNWSLRVLPHEARHVLRLAHTIEQGRATRDSSIKDPPAETDGAR